MSWMNGLLCEGDRATKEIHIFFSSWKKKKMKDSKSVEKKIHGNIIRTYVYI